MVAILSEWWSVPTTVGTSLGDDMKAKKLPTLLESEAIAMWFELTSKEQ